ncbi:MAG: ABC transporter substrate-binding protein [Alphaproteobacteria bacterium]|nr:ABC transporter substrate-binding protein [Alphaproteobacteria bacterium]
MKSKIILLATAAAMMAGPALAAEKIKIGFVTTLSKGPVVIGKDMQNSVELALDHIGRKMAGKDVEVVYGDDKFNPQDGKQETERLLQRDKVDIIAGYIWSNVLLASWPVARDAGKIMISSNAGPSQLAGKGCHKNFFNISWQNDQTPMALGELLNRQGVKSLYIIAPNYAAGKNMVSGVERTFKGKVVGKDMTKWPAQKEWAAELTKVKAANPEGVFVFYPGGHGPAFVKEFTLAGLNGKIPLYSVYTLDSISLPLFQKANMNGVMGTVMTQQWVPDLDNEQNKRFVADFKKKHGKYPSFYGSQAYDTIFFIKDAVEAVNGDMSNIDGLRARMQDTQFKSVRGKFKMGANHFPVQDFWSRKVVADADGNWTTSAGEVVLKDHQDVYAKDCKM